MIVVGDEKQLPPTDFFSPQRPDEDDDADEPVSRRRRRIRARRRQPARATRARAPADDARLALPEPRRVADQLLQRRRSTTAAADRARPRRAATRGETPHRRPPADAAHGVGAVLDRPLSFHRLERGVYEDRRNPAEADYIAALLRELLQLEQGPAVGVVAFSEAQQDEIERR